MGLRNFSKFRHFSSPLPSPVPQVSSYGARPTPVERGLTMGLRNLKKNPRFQKKSPVFKKKNHFRMPGRSVFTILKRFEISRFRDVLKSRYNGNKSLPETPLKRGLTFVQTHCAKCAVRLNKCHAALGRMRRRDVDNEAEQLALIEDQCGN